MPVCRHRFLSWLLVFLACAVPVHTAFSAAKVPVLALLKALKAKDEPTRAKAAGALGRLAPKAKEAIPALIEALKDKSEWVQEMASEALQEFGQDAMPFFVKALTHPNGRVRLQVMKLLHPSDASEAQDKAILRKALPDLLKALKDKDPDIRKEAIWLLGESGDKKAIPAILILMKTDKEAEVQDAAVECFREFGPEGKAAIPDLKHILITNPTDERRLFLAFKSLESIGSASVPVIVELLNSPDSTIRKNALDSLRSMRGRAQAAVPHLVKALETQDEERRVDIIAVLRDMGPGAKAAIPTLKTLLKSLSTDVRIMASEALHTIDPKTVEGVPVLIKIIQNEQDEGIRWEAAWALGSFGPKAKAGVPALLQALQNKKVHFAAFTALQAIGGTGEKPTLAALVKLLSEPDPELRVTALTSLKELGQRAKNALPSLLTSLQHKSEKVRNAAAMALSAVGPNVPPAVKSLTKSLQDSSVRVRMAAAYALTQIDGNNQEGVKVLLAELKADQKWSIRHRAIELLGGTGHRAKCAIPTLIQVFSTNPVGIDPGEEDSLLSARTSAHSLLREFGPPTRPAIQAYLAALDDENSWICYLAGNSLGYIRPDAAKEVIPALIKRLHHKDPTNRERAVKILEKMGQDARKAMPALVEALDDRDARVRSAARDAFNAIQRKKPHARRPKVPDSAASS